MIVGNIQAILRHNRTKIYIAKPITLSLLLENEIEHKDSSKVMKSLHVENNLLSKHYIISTKIETKIVLSTHKLHSLHPFI